MTTVIIEDSTLQAKNLLAYIRSFPFVKVKTEEPEFNLYESLDRAFADVRLMQDGKKREKTIVQGECKPNLFEFAEQQPIFISLNRKIKSFTDKMLMRNNEM